MPSNAITGQIVTCLDFCHTFPVARGLQIQRENILHTLDSLVEAGKEIVTVNAEDGLGKTSLLAQFAKRHQDVALCVFVQPGSRLGSDPDLLLIDLHNQAKWLLSEHDIPDTQEFDDGAFQKTLFDLQKKARRQKNKYYFIIDGVDELPPDASLSKNAILRVLPFGYDEFRFILSGARSSYPDLRPELVVETLPLSPFTFGETQAYFGQTLSEPQLQEVYSVTKGKPSHLASLRRLLDSGLHAEELIESLPNTLSALFEIEWRAVSTRSEGEQLMLALMAFAKHDITPKDLVALSGRDSHVIENWLANLSFIVTPDHDGLPLKFVSKSFRDYAVSKLTQFRETAEEQLISYLLTTPDSRASLNSLPEYLNQPGKLQELLRYLSPEHFIKVIDDAQSLTPVKERVKLGINAARSLGKVPDVLSFAIQQSLLVELDHMVASESEVDAHLALGDFDAALIRAQSAILKEDRLQLLSLIATKTRERGLSPDAELIDQINQLFREIDFSSIGEKAFSLATGLMGVRPELAIKAIEAMSNAKSGSNADLAFARLSIQGVMDKSSTKVSEDDVSEVFRNNIKDNTVRGMSTAITFLVGSYSQSEIIAEVEKLSNPIDRLFVLRQWLRMTEDGKKGAGILEYSLKLAIQTTEYTPTASHLLEFANPLPIIESVEQLRLLIEIFDTQSAITAHLGPIQDLLGLQILLAESAAAIGLKESEDRFASAFSEICKVKESDTSASCVANLIASINRVLAKHQSVRLESLEKQAREKLDVLVAEILINTAEQVYALKDVIAALAITDGSYCLGLCRRMNTVYRRDQAIKHFLDALVSAKVRQFDFAIAKQALDGINDSFHREKIYLRLLTRLYRIASKAVVDDNFLKGSNAFLGMCDELEGMEERALCCTISASILAKNESMRTSTLHQHLIDAGYRAWLEIDSDYNKLEIGFNLAGFLAEHSREKARAYLSDAVRSRTTAALALMYDPHIDCLRLGIRAFGALIDNEIVDDQDRSLIRSRISKISSKHNQVVAWSEIALSYFRSGRDGLGKSVVNNEIYPILHDLKVRDKATWERAATAAAPALVSTNIDTGLEIISSFSPSFRDLAVSASLRFLFNKLIASEPLDYSGEERYHITYGEARDACRLMRLLTNDSTLYLNIETLLASLRWKENNKNITEQQKADICSDIETIISLSLPNSMNITHDGYAILGKAQLLKTRKAKDLEWTPIVSQARNVPNAADRVYVLATVARLYSGKDTNLPSILWKEAEELTKSLPCLVDRIERYQIISDESELIDPEFSKRCLRAAIREPVRDSDGEEVWEAQRRIVDAAHRVSKELASALASEIDDDEARVAIKARLRNRVKVLDYKRELSKPDDSAALQLKRGRLTSEAARMALGSLNANRSEPIHLSGLQERIYETGTVSMTSGFNLYSFAIENAARTYRKGVAASQVQLKGVFQATMRGCDLSELLTGHQSTRIQKSMVGTEDATMKSSLVRAGEREHGLALIQRWLNDYGSEYLYVSDPYLGPEEVALILRMVLRSHRNLSVSVLTSKLHQKDEKVPEPYHSSYAAHWIGISDQEPPETLVLIVGLRSSKKSPIHPRWWLTKGSGIRVDTSLNSLGGSTDSEIFPLNSIEIAERTAELREYFELRKRDHQGERLEITTFTLPDAS